MEALLDSLGGRLGSGVFNLLLALVVSYNAGQLRRLRQGLLEERHRAEEERDKLR